MLKSAINLKDTEYMINLQDISSTIIKQLYTKYKKHYKYNTNINNIIFL